mmetsp:Transcript_671/g.485  ORF Transcript_671/g.485 Transcript_671/m.485 type:complete len:130 (+) Transcript_671:94-483(+)
MKPIPVTRNNSRKDFKRVIDCGQKALANGKSVIVFLQARRSRVFDPSTFNSMGVKLAKRANVMVVPIAFKTDFQSIGTFIKDVGPINIKRPINIKFGKPFPVEENDKKAHNYTIQFIKSSLKEWGCEVG